MLVRTLRRISLPLLTASLLVFAACGGDDDDDTGNPDAAAGGPDAPTGTPDAPPVTPDAAPTPDAPVTTIDAGGTSGQVFCGESTYCDLPQVCCVTGMGGGATAECTDEASCTGGQTAVIKCDGPEDCTVGGEVCCGGLTSSGADCMASGDCTGFNRVICHNAATDCPGDSDECCPTDYGGGYCSSFGCY